RRGSEREPMSSWTAHELDRIEGADEIELASVRADGTLRGFVTIWAVRVGDDVYVRSAYGYDNPWFQRALTSGRGRIRAAGVERDVRFEVPEPDVADDVTAAYHAKYDGHGARIVATVVSPEAVRSTLRVLPA
ncbi:MAG: DUF2255 family protein, partial [Chloroflexota bacterium]